MSTGSKLQSTLIIRVQIIRCEQSTLSGSFLHSFSGVAIGSDELWNCFKGNVGETSERWGGVHMGSPECIDTILN